MENNSKGDQGAKKNKKKEILVIHSESQLFNALKTKSPFQFGSSFELIRLPLKYDGKMLEMPFKALKHSTTIKTILFGEGTWDRTNLDALEKSLIANSSIDTISLNYFSEAHKNLVKTIVKILTKSHRIQHLTIEGIEERTAETIFDSLWQNIHLFGLKSLKIVELFNTFKLNPAVFEALPNSPTITSLNVKFSPYYTDKVSGYIIDALLANPRITDIEFGTPDGKGFTVEKWLQFKPVLERDQLKRLILVNLLYDEMKVQKEEFNNVMAVMDLMQNLKNLEEIGFVSGNINWMFLGNILSHNKIIKKLNLQFVDFDLKDLNLAKNETLEEVSLSNCNLHDNGELAEVIRHNTTMKKLHYKTINFSQDDFDQFVDAFKNNSTLTDVQFIVDHADTQLSELFSRVLAVNRGIRKLKFNLQNSEYESLSVCRFIYALKNNTTLNELSFEKFNVQFIGKHTQLLADLLKVNQSLTYIQGSEEFPEIDTALKRNLDNQRKLITNGKMFVKMLLMRPKTYGGIIPPEIWCMILRHMTAPGSAWNAEQFYRQNFLSPEELVVVLS